MDFYIAALGRSGSTALANWLTCPPDYFVFHEPGLLRDRPTRLFNTQLEDWGVSKESVFAGHWAAKETQSEIHPAMMRRFGPPKVILGVRRVRDAALSLFEKHRRQGLLQRYSDEWSADYLVREAAGLTQFAETLARAGTPSLIVRYEEFGDALLRSVADWVGWPGGGDMARGFDTFGRAFEAERHRDRSLPAEALHLADALAERCASFERSFYT